MPKPVSARGQAHRRQLLPSTDAFFYPTTPLPQYIYPSGPATSAGYAPKARVQPKGPPAPVSTWAQVAKKAAKRVDVGAAKPVAPTPKPTPAGTAPNPQRYTLTTDEIAAFKHGNLPQRLLPGFISRAVGAYRHLSGMTRQGPLPRHVFVMIRNTARRNLFAMCGALINSAARHEATLKAQAASAAASRKNLPQVTKNPEAPKVKIETKVVEVNVTPKEVKEELASLRELVKALQATVEKLSKPAPLPVLHAVNYFKDLTYKLHTKAELAKAPDSFEQKRFESTNAICKVVYAKTYLDVVIESKGGAIPPVTLLRVGRKSLKVTASGAVPFVYSDLCNVASNYFLDVPAERKAIKLV
jgi:hypothetical protein